MAKVKVDGQSYPVVDSLGFVHSVGQRAWMIRLPDGSEKIVVGKMNNARFWTARDRVQPIIDAIARGPAASRWF